MNINYYVTKDDDGNEKYIMTIDAPTVEIESLSAEEIGAAVKEAISQPPVAI